MAEGYVLESREEIGLGKTIDILLTKGTIHVGDGVAYNTNEGPVAGSRRSPRFISVPISGSFESHKEWLK